MQFGSGNDAHPEALSDVSDFGAELSQQLSQSRLISVSEDVSHNRARAVGLTNMREQFGTFIADAKARADETPDLRVKNGVLDLSKIAEAQTGKLALRQKDFAKIIGNGLKTGNKTPLSTANDSEQWQREVNGQRPATYRRPEKTTATRMTRFCSGRFWDLAATYMIKSDEERFVAQVTSTCILSLHAVLGRLISEIAP